MKRILFVEDNEILLELYGMLLNSERNHWQTTLAPDGETALKLLQQTAFDVVASDMQMPGMNGIQLLAEVRKLYPQTSRIIISGFTDQAEAADALSCTHLFIPKPFDTKILRTTLARIGSLDAYLKDDKLRGLAGKMRALPSFPTLYLDIIREIESPNSSTQGIAKIIAQDPGITAKILQVANSAAMGLPEKVSDPVDAVQQLGMTTVRSLVLSAQVYGSYAPGRLKGFSAEALWTHLMKCGDLARTLMRREHAEFADSEDAFTAGMLHDMGKLMLADSLPDDFGRALKLAVDEKISLPEAEMEIFGATHAGLAAYLLGLWGLPAAIVEAVAFHHTPEKSDLKKCSALTAVHVANSLSDSTGTVPLNLEYLAEIGVSDRLDDWRDTAAELQTEPCA
ncbi:MAG TPA: response regulator [Verrucomicrobiae bacterium]|jgi:HD-like signal output (HDOD) protein|nr:response regulator [Verrucomicrobiae bacterium]